MALGVAVQPAFGFHLADEDVQRRRQLRMAQLADAGTNFPQKSWYGFGPGRLGKEQQESQLRPARPNGILSLNRERDGPVKPRNRGFELAVFTIAALEPVEQDLAWPARPPVSRGLEGIG